MSITRYEWWSDVKVRVRYGSNDRYIPGYSGRLQVESLILELDRLAEDKLDVRYSKDDGYRFFAECEVCGDWFDIDKGFVFYEDGFEGSNLVELVNDKVYLVFDTSIGGGVFCDGCKEVYGLVR